MIQNLLTAVHKYYPIGCPEIYNHYDGIKEIEKIILHKYAEIEDNNETPHSRLVSFLKNEFPEYQVFDFSHLQFPSYTIVIEVDEQEFNGIKSTIRITLVISLLIKFYTIYISNIYDFNGIEYINKRNGPRHEIVYFKDCKNELLLKVTETINVAAKTYFTQHDYIHHYILFSNTVKSGKSLFDLEKDYGRNYCYYDYLFSIDKAHIDDFEILF